LVSAVSTRKQESNKGIAMKIESSTKSITSSGIKEVRGNSTGKTSPTPTDDVQLSDLSTRLTTSDSEPVFDAGRVSEIKQAISEGRFTIDASAIADRLITSAMELVDSQRKA